MGRPKTIENRELLAVALRVFRLHGHTATTRDVARAAGISQAVLYQRFKTKDDLFFAALAPHVPALSALFEIDASAHGPRAYLSVFAARAKDHFRNAIPSILRLATHPKYSKDLMFQIHQHNRAGEVAAMLNMRLLTWQQAGKIRPTNPREFSSAFLHALHSMAMIDVFTGDLKKPTRVEDMRGFVDIFWLGLKPASARAKHPSTRTAKEKKRR
jgi:AcrR family transcriptional regulator